MFTHGARREYSLWESPPTITQAAASPEPDGMSLPEDPVSPDADRPAKSIHYLDIIHQITTKAIQQASTQDRPLLLGVNGVDTSGKTEFARTLADQLEALGTPHTLVHVDDFMNPRAERHKGIDPVDDYYNHAINFSDIKDGLLLPIRRGTASNYIRFEHPHPALDTYVLNHEYQIYPPASIVVVEGVFLFRSGFPELFDMRVFLDLSLDNVLARARDRDLAWGGEEVLDKYRGKYIPTQEMYLRLAKPALLSDIVIDMNDPAYPCVNT